MENTGKEKILLVLLPFWTPLIPPIGINSLKGFLREYGYKIKTVDANIEEGYREIYHEYFNKIKEYVPEEKRGNFLSIGTDVLRNHMMGYIYHDNENKYTELVKILVKKTYHTDLDDRRVTGLNQIVKKLFTWIEYLITGLIEKEKPGLLGISVNKDTVPASLFAFRLTRERYPHIRTVIGGTIFSEQLTVNSPNFKYFLAKTRRYIDKVIIGPGEMLFLKYLQGELPESQRVYTQGDLRGEDIDFTRMPIPDYSDMNVGYYPYLGASGSIGCQYNCSFCNVVQFFGSYKHKKAGQIADEMIQAHKLYGSQLFFMSDNMANPYIDDLAGEFIARDEAIYWSAYMRVDQAGCDKDNVLSWRRGGLYSARLGVDSGSPRVLEMMDKRITPDLSTTMITTLASSGIKTTTYWLVGHPGETGEDFQQTLDLLEELKDYIWEAECEYFNYYYSGQSHSDNWANRRMLVYPESTKEMLLIDKWCVGGEPSWEEIFRRVCRFVEHCRKLGIPNPYSLKEIYMADERWKRLHRNSVPSLLEFKDSADPIDECKHIEQFHEVKNNREFRGDFNF
jgi:hypothetical protein